MKIINDNDWQNFAAKVLSVNTTEKIPPAFFEHFYWDNIAEKAAATL